MKCVEIKQMILEKMCVSVIEEFDSFEFNFILHWKYTILNILFISYQRIKEGNHPTQVMKSSFKKNYLKLQVLNSQQFMCINIDVVAM